MAANRNHFPANGEIPPAPIPGFLPLPATPPNPAPPVAPRPTEATSAVTYSSISPSDRSVFRRKIDRYKKWTTEVAEQGGVAVTESSYGRAAGVGSADWGSLPTVKSEGTEPTTVAEARLRARHAIPISGAAAAPLICVSTPPEHEIARPPVQPVHRERIRPAHQPLQPPKPAMPEHLVPPGASNLTRKGSALQVPPASPAIPKIPHDGKPPSAHSNTLKAPPPSLKDPGSARNSIYSHHSGNSTHSAFQEREAYIESALHLPLEMLAERAAPPPPASSKLTGGRLASLLSIRGFQTDSGPKPKEDGLSRSHTIGAVPQTSSRLKDTPPNASMPTLRSTGSASRKPSPLVPASERQQERVKSPSTIRPVVPSSATAKAPDQSLQTAESQKPPALGSATSNRTTKSQKAPQPNSSHHTARLYDTTVPAPIPALGGSSVHAAAQVPLPPSTVPAQPLSLTPPAPGSAASGKSTLRAAAQVPLPASALPAQPSHSKPPAMGSAVSGSSTVRAAKRTPLPASTMPLGGSMAGQAATVSCSLGHSVRAAAQVPLPASTTPMQASGVQSAAAGSSVSEHTLRAAARAPVPASTSSLNKTDSKPPALRSATSHLTARDLPDLPVPETPSQPDSHEPAHRQPQPLPRPALSRQASVDGITRTLGRRHRDPSTANLTARFEPEMYPLPDSHTTAENSKSKVSRGHSIGTARLVNTQQEERSLPPVPPTSPTTPIPARTHSSRKKDPTAKVTTAGPSVKSPAQSQSQILPSLVADTHPSVNGRHDVSIEPVQIAPPTRTSEILQPHPISIPRTQEMVENPASQPVNEDVGSPVTSRGHAAPDRNIVMPVSQLQSPIHNLQFSPVSSPRRHRHGNEELRFEVPSGSRKLRVSVAWLRNGQRTGPSSYSDTIQSAQSGPSAPPLPPKPPSIIERMRRKTQDQQGVPSSWKHQQQQDGVQSDDGASNQSPPSISSPRSPLPLGHNFFNLYWSNMQLPPYTPRHPQMVSAYQMQPRGQFAYPQPRVYPPWYQMRDQYARPPGSPKQRPVSPPDSGSTKPSSAHSHQDSPRSLESHHSSPPPECRQQENDQPDFPPVAGGWYQQHAWEPFQGQRSSQRNDGKPSWWQKVIGKSRQDGQENDRGERQGEDRNYESRRDRQPQNYNSRRFKPPPLTKPYYRGPPDQFGYSQREGRSRPEGSPQGRQVQQHYRQEYNDDLGRWKRYNSLRRDAPRHRRQDSNRSVWDVFRRRTDEMYYRSPPRRKLNLPPPAPLPPLSTSYAPDRYRDVPRRERSTRSFGFPMMRRNTQTNQMGGQRRVVPQMNGYSTGRGGSSQERQMQKEQRRAMKAQRREARHQRRRERANGFPSDPRYRSTGGRQGYTSRNTGDRGRDMGMVGDWARNMRRRMTETVIWGPNRSGQSNVLRRPSRRT